jgi:hypothetical protein
MADIQIECRVKIRHGPCSIGFEADEKGGERIEQRHREGAAGEPVQNVAHRQPPRLRIAARRHFDQGVDRRSQVRAENQRHAGV